jgi:hypothetical protein
MPSSFTVRGRAQGLNPRRSKRPPTDATLTKDHDHGSHEEEEEDEEGSEEVLIGLMPISQEMASPSD